jgi:hypothetical protein
MHKEISSTSKMILESAAVLFLIAFASWIWRPSNARVPDELIGEWHTSDPNYSDRSFEIDSVSVNFGTGGGTNTTGFIKKISAVPQGARTFYTISYAADDSVNEMSFYYETAKGKVIRFRNQEGIAWTKD